MTDRAPAVAGEPIDLSRPFVFNGTALRHFGAPSPGAAPLRAGSFVGDVRAGGSCNCTVITFVPHCHGTHTESVAHLTEESLDAWRVAPLRTLDARLVTVRPGATGPHGDRVIDRSLLEAALGSARPRHAEAIVVRVRPLPAADTNPPWFSVDAIDELVARGVGHLVTELPSIDRTEDGGRLAAHRAFFGLPPHSRRLADARRPWATVTELAHVPDATPDGDYALALHVAPIAGDAAPNRVLLYGGERS